MEKILFMCINMNIGGTEKALLTMLNEIDRSKYEITLLMLEEYGGFLKEIPIDIKVKYLKGFDKMKRFLKEPPQLLAKKLISEGQYLRGISTFYNYGISKVKKDISHYYKYVCKDIESITEEYDLAVAYAGPMDFISYYILNEVKAKKKAQWIHFDVTKIGFNKEFVDKNYKKFDKIFVVSDEGKEKLVKLIPGLEGNVETFFNIISSDLIKAMSNNSNSYEDNFDGTRILTVGRLSIEKGQDLTIKALKRLKDDGYKVRWYCVGTGPEDNNYINEIKRLGIEEDYILLGAKLNPYPYMNDCDIYMQPSKYEGYCITLGEARCFNNPIVTTNFTGANEQIKEEVNGLVCDINEESIYKAIKKMLDNKELFNSIKANLDNEVVDSTGEIRKLEKLINS